MSRTASTTASPLQQHQAATSSLEQPPAAIRSASSSAPSSTSTGVQSPFIAGSPQQRERQHRRSGSWQKPQLTVSSPALTASPQLPAALSSAAHSTTPHVTESRTAASSSALQSPGSAPVPTLRASQSAAGSQSTYHRSTHQKTQHRPVSTFVPGSWHSSPVPVQPASVGSRLRYLQPGAQSLYPPPVAAPSMPPSAAHQMTYPQTPTAWTEPFAGLSLHTPPTVSTSASTPAYVTVPVQHLAYPPVAYAPIYSQAPTPAQLPPAQIQQSVMQEWVSMFTQFPPELRVQSLLQIVNVCTGVETAQLAALLIDRMNTESASRELSTASSRQQSPPSPTTAQSRSTAASSPTQPHSRQKSRSVSTSSAGGFAAPAQAQSQTTPTSKTLTTQTQPSTPKAQPTIDAGADEIIRPVSQPNSPTRLVKPSAKRNSSTAGLQPSTPVPTQSRSPSPSKATPAT